MVSLLILASMYIVLPFAIPLCYALTWLSQQGCVVEDGVSLTRLATLADVH